MPIEAGRLRHVVDFQVREDTQDETTGGVTTTWRTAFADVRASIEHLSARDMVAAQKEQSSVVARIVVRFRPGMNEAHRIVHGTKCCRFYVGEEIFKPAGFLRDNDTGLEYVTIPCSTSDD